MKVMTDASAREYYAETLKTSGTTSRRKSRWALCSTFARLICQCARRITTLKSHKGALRNGEAMATSPLRCAVHQKWGLIAAPSGWVVATFGADNTVSYRGVVAFMVGLDCVKSAFTVEGYDPKFSAVVDPCSGKFISVADGKICSDEAAFVAAMKALRQLLDEVPEGRPEVAH